MKVQRSFPGMGVNSLQPSISGVALSIGVFRVSVCGLERLSDSLVSSRRYSSLGSSSRSSCIVLVSFASSDSSHISSSRLPLYIDCTKPLGPFKKNYLFILYTLYIGYIPFITFFILGAWLKTKYRDSQKRSSRIWRRSFSCKIKY